MLSFLLLFGPTIVYLLIQLAGGHFRTALSHAGVAWGTPGAYGLALLMLPALVFTGWLAITVTPADVLEMPGVSIARFGSIGAVAGVVLRALGEEVLFRGLIGGALMRRFGFAWGNLFQAAVFLAPHLLLLMVDARLWPVLPVQFVAGWLFGWLRHRSGSFVPGALVHVVANVVAGLLLS